MTTTFEQHRQECSIIAILRGLKPERSADVAAALIEAGIRLIEVPMNSPSPFQSIQTMTQKYSGSATFGAGTLQTVDQLTRLRDSGGQLAISPHVDPNLIASSLRLELIPMPGFFTPSEAFLAIQSGAVHLKYFPAVDAGPSLLKNTRVVLPNHVQVFAVGGINAENIHSWKKRGVHGFGIGSAIFRPTYSIDDIHQRASLLVQQLRSQ